MPSLGVECSASCLIFIPWFVPPCTTLPILAVSFRLMRAIFFGLISMVSLPFLAQGQSTLSFPRAIQPSELGTSGFAVVNPGTDNATATFTLYKADGTIGAVSTQTVPRRGQISKLGSELFPSATNAGWVEATSTSYGLQGFWLGGDFVNFADGADAAASSPELILPIVTPRSEIHIANTGTSRVTVVMRLYGEEGFELAPVAVQSIPPKGFFKAESSALFPSPNLATATHVKLTCVNPFAATVIVRDFIAGPSWAVANAVPSSLPATNINFPNVVDGPLSAANYRSVLGITNLSANPNDVTITFTSEDGLLVRSIQRTIPANGAIRDIVRNLFGITDLFLNGWVKVTGLLPITGFVAYADTVAGEVAIVPTQSEPQANLLFAHIADLPPWLTGLALLNTGSRAANIEIFALAPDGSLIGGAENVATARFALPAGTKTSKLLSQWIPQTQTRTSDGGFIYVRSDVPVYGIELFFSRSLLILSNVAAGKIVPGITYVPPPPR